MSRHMFQKRARWPHCRELGRGCACSGGRLRHQSHAPQGWQLRTCRSSGPAAALRLRDVIDIERNTIRMETHVARRAASSALQLQVNVVTALIQEPVRASWLCSAETIRSGPSRADDWTTRFIPPDMKWLSKSDFRQKCPGLLVHSNASRVPKRAHNLLAGERMRPPANLAG